MLDFKSLDILEHHLLERMAWDMIHDLFEFEDVRSLLVADVGFRQYADDETGLVERLHAKGFIEERDGKYRANEETTRYYLDVHYHRM